MASVRAGLPVTKKNMQRISENFSMSRRNIPLSPLSRQGCRTISRWQQKKRQKNWSFSTGSGKNNRVDVVLDQSPAIFNRVSFMYFLEIREHTIGSFLKIADARHGFF